MRAGEWGLLAVAAGLVAWWAVPRRQAIAPGELAEGSPAQLPSPLESLVLDVTAPAPAPVYDALDARARAANLAAFQHMLAVSEGTDRAGGYATLYGSAPGALSLMDSYDDHPALLGWPGVPLSPAQCEGAGIAPPCVSTAAGRYQINRPTWRPIKQALGLIDFSPESQDAAASELLRRNGALELVELGRFDEAVSKVRKVWASLPGAGYPGQAENQLDALRQIYAAAGGALA